MTDKLATKPVRRALSVLSTPIGSSYSNAEMQFRLAQVFPQPTRCWRLHIRNYNVLGDAAIASGASFAPVYIGQQAVDANGDETGAFTAVPTQALPAFTLPADGSEYTSAWVTDAALQMIPGKPMLFDFAYTGGGTQQYGYGRMWFAAGAGRAAGVGSQNGYSGGLASIQTSVFDIRIEYEFAGDRQVIAVIGDSTASSNGGVASEPMSQWRRWPERWGVRTGHPVANGAIPSTSMGNTWTNTAKWAYQRLKPQTVTYDAVISDVGINDVNGGSSLATYKTNDALMVAAIRSVFTSARRIFACALKPFDSYATAASGFPSGRLTAPVAAGASTFTSSSNWSNGDVLQIGDGYTAESVTVSGAPTGSAPGPYTVTITGTFSRAHQIHEPVSGAKETIRRGVNTWLGSLPSGRAGFFRTDRAVTANQSDNLWDPVASSDGLHPSIHGHASEAAAVPSIDRSY